MTTERRFTLPFGDHICRPRRWSHSSNTRSHWLARGWTCHHCRHYVTSHIYFSHIFLLFYSFLNLWHLDRYRIKDIPLKNYLQRGPWDELTINWLIHIVICLFFWQVRSSEHQTVLSSVIPKMLNLTETLTTCFLELAVK